MTEWIGAKVQAEVEKVTKMAGSSVKVEVEKPKSVTKRERKQYGAAVRNSERKTRQNYLAKGL